MAYTSYVYSSFSGFDDAYDRFRAHVSGSVNLHDAEHIDQLFTWLRRWGCRQFTMKGEAQAKRLIAEWYDESVRDLPTPGMDIWMLPDDTLKTACKVYGKLMRLKVGVKKNKQEPRVGATGAAKILFALRPKSLMAWDYAIYKRLGCGKDAESYGEFLREVRRMVADLREECRTYGISLEQVPAKLGRADHTLPKLIDEYLWLTASQGRPLPDLQTLGDWKNWARALSQARQHARE
jgi:hypothetical protein